MTTDRRPAMPGGPAMPAGPGLPRSVSAPVSAARPARSPNRRGRLLAFARRPVATLAGRFLLANLVILLVGGVLIGLWVGSHLERSIIDRTASITALYVDSLIEPKVESLATGAWLNAGDIAELDTLLGDTPLAARIVALKIWSPAGTIVYSPDRTLIGHTFPVEGGLAGAVSGQVVADMSDLQDAENAAERARYDHLLEMYVPVRQRGSERIIAVAEFYQLPEELDREVAGARLSTWIIVGAAVLMSYLLLYGVVRQGSLTIERQQAALRRQVGELSAVVEQNAALHGRVAAAAERSTTLSERALRRISSDLHDGPAQMLSLALMRLDKGRGAPITDDDERHRAIEGALQDALSEMRAIAAGLRLPELDAMAVPDVAVRAVEDHRRRTGSIVELETGRVPALAALPVKIALYRALQELLSNASRHGRGAISVRLGLDGRLLRLEVSDEGEGFDRERVGEPGHLGLAGIREQAELLGGGFLVEGTAGGGSVVVVSWPVSERASPAHAAPDRPPR
jgi:signal transduction histidine kinase